jgi:hypothetical protein
MRFPPSTSNSLVSLWAGNAMTLPCVGACIMAVLAKYPFGNFTRHWTHTQVLPSMFQMPIASSSPESDDSESDTSQASPDTSTSDPDASESGTSSESDVPIESPVAILKKPAACLKRPACAQWPAASSRSAKSVSANDSEDSAEMRALFGSDSSDSD